MHLAAASLDPPVRQGLTASSKSNHILVEQSFHSALSGDIVTPCHLETSSSGKDTSRRSPASLETPLSGTSNNPQASKFQEKDP